MYVLKLHMYMYINLSFERYKFVSLLTLVQYCPHVRMSRRTPDRPFSINPRFSTHK